MNDSIAVGQRVKLNIFVRDDVNAKIFRRALRQQIPVAVDGGEFFYRIKGVGVRRQKFFKRGIFSGERQNFFRQGISLKQHVDKICGLAFGDKQRVVVFEAAIGKRVVNAPVKVLGNQIARVDILCKGVDVREHVGEHDKIRRVKQPVNVKHARNFFVAHKLGQLMKILLGVKIMPRLREERLSRNKSVENFQRI